MDDVDKCLEKLKRCELLSQATIKDICTRVIDVLLDESNVCEVDAPVTVVGDVHGQFYDLLEIFQIGGECPDTRYLFLGDYVDRGHFNLETITLLTCLKLRWPDRITLLRGNHESRQITQVYGFYKEVVQKYGSADVWSYFCEVFDYLPLSAIIAGKIFCVHGGLSPAVLSVDQIKLIDRFREPPSEGVFADLLWSDPSDRDGFNLSQRNAGHLFGKDTVERFLHVNGLSTVLRAHQLCMEGYQIHFDGLLATVWSAPNYCYRCGNVASICEIDASLNREFNVFSAAPEDRREVPSGQAKQVPDYFL
ncbi:serine/threonine protein phosphatase [Thecamonas trahens ATCC 50062]|uniref:Serine/threonine-protein phosphatase n=1 Tax=Thecamonas trahens ATCC 50062 TaxID=461836 RepID=A0A0L0DJW7_THETB|nr:serine/threonine protein phosphatase [Thecamonas trahens ATCC 50062]KNC52391.1 serine/threonine protein phosphatase [Thecamonas trahens ATCC 50062]|eukprot:XP_013755435.1 serine/threonine protein phosphatase [Thecamonas trahens ATCC 50062]